MLLSRWRMVSFTMLQLLLTSFLASDAYARTNAFSERGCPDNPYCSNVNGSEVWKNDCGIEKPSIEGFEENKHELVKFFTHYFNDYVQHWNNKTLAEDEETVPAFMAKRLAPNISPSAVWCDGMSKCQIPSCKDFGHLLTKREKEMAWYVFEFFSVLDHTQDAMYQGTNDFFDVIHWDVRHFTQTFTYSDELQTVAEMKDQLRKMKLGIAQSMTLLAAAITAGTASVMTTVGAAAVSVGASVVMSGAAGAISAIGRATSSFGYIAIGIGAGAKAVKDPIGAIINNGFIGVQNLVLTLDPAKDIKGYEKLVEAYEHYMGTLLTQSLGRLHEDNIQLMTGGITRNGLNLVKLFTMGNSQAPDIRMRAYQTEMMRLYYSATAINNLWQREGTYIVETNLQGEDCFADNRGHHRNRVCLYERPDKVYWLFAVGLDKQNSLTSPPGLWQLGTPPGFNNLRLQDVVRSSLWKEEQRDMHFKGPYDPPDASTILTQPIYNITYPTEEDFANASDALNKTANQTQQPGALDHYGVVPGAFSLPICRSWTGTAITSINVENAANAPCVCDGAVSNPWSTINVESQLATEKFLNNSRLYENKKYGRLCTERHGCTLERDRWKDVLHLPEDATVAVDQSWSTCNMWYPHSEKGHQIE